VLFLFMMLLGIPATLHCKYFRDTHIINSVVIDNTIPCTVTLSRDISPVLFAHRRTGRYAPPYANLFMGRIEEMINQEWEGHIIFWKRFIDDIFFIFQGDIGQLLRLKKFMNDIHDTIKFTFEQSLTDIDFLDTHLSLE